MSKGYISHGMKVGVDSLVFGNTIKKPQLMLFITYIETIFMIHQIISKMGWADFVNTESKEIR